MRSFVAYTLLASATLAVAVDPRFEYPDTVPLVKRQQPGTPQYACHEDCGLLITLARENKDFCDSQEWNDHYDQCMECAETYGIWKYYGSGVSKVAGQCDLSPTPSPSGAATKETATSSSDGSGTTAPGKITTEAPTEVPSTTIAIESTVIATPSAMTTTDVSSVNTATSTPEPSSVAVNGAAKHFEFTTAIVFAAFAIFNLY
ncbi:unnamed protein product [Fusarium graminearum]|nr:hypothetical protein FG05_01771 [Fusarium graminearum]KAI6770683.1 hypothetical protein HG531_009538 [Fusarium graminearum]PCD38780.1 hypothetical protein FGRA07_00051 [Fusarium graminearum]CAF3475822.1 unnamed protein product [Fusarium graminearum]CAF3607594.1 unnamed protein product [Fusarium graminearum]